MWRSYVTNLLHLFYYSNIYPTRCKVIHFILSGNCSTCFKQYHHPSSGAQTTVSTASGIYHTVTAICLHDFDRENFIVYFVLSVCPVYNLSKPVPFQWVCTMWVTFTVFIKTCMCMNFKYLKLVQFCVSYILLTYSMEQRSSWEANWSAASQEIPRILWNPKVHHHTHNRTPPVPILR